MGSSTGSSITGHFSDGQTAASHEVGITLGPDGILFGPEGRPPTHHWPFDDLESDSPLLPSASPSRLSSKQEPDARLTFCSAEFAEALLKAAPQVSQAAKYRRMIGIVLLCLAGVAAIAALAWWILQQSVIAEIVPDSWWRQAGVKVEQALIGKHKQCHGMEGKKALARLVFRFADSVEPDAVRVYEMPTVNAFAMAGGRVVITSELIKRAGSPDEVAGVLAHELGHVKARHPEIQLYRVLGLQALLSVFGSGHFIQGGALLTLLSYTRAAEREADTLAIALMRKAGINPHGLANFFAARKKEAAAKAVKIPDILGDLIHTHPDLDERIKAIRKQNPGETTPALSAENWRKLKTICH